MKSLRGSFSFMLREIRGSEALMLLMLLLLEATMASHAQAGRYNGPGSTSKESARASPVRRMQSPEPKTGREVLACNFGVDEARGWQRNMPAATGAYTDFEGFSWDCTE